MTSSHRVTGRSIFRQIRTKYKKLVSLQCSARIVPFQRESLGGAMIDFNRGNYETAGGRSDRQAINSLPFSRRSFLVKTSCFGVFYALGKLIPLQAVAAELGRETCRAAR